MLFQKTVVLQIRILEDLNCACCLIFFKSEDMYFTGKKISIISLFRRMLYCFCRKGCFLCISIQRTVVLCLLEEACCLSIQKITVLCVL